MDCQPLASNDACVCGMFPYLFDFFSHFNNGVGKSNLSGTAVTVTNFPKVNIQPPVLSIDLKFMYFSLNDLRINRVMFVMLGPDGWLAVINLVFLSCQCVECLLRVEYSGGDGLQASHCRQCAVNLSVDICPSVIIQVWDALPAERYSNRKNCSRK